MKTLIYQYWDGKVRPSCKAGVENMKKYAEKIGSEYQFDQNERFFKGVLPHYGCFKPAFLDKYYEYDYIMFADTDVFVLDRTTESIFEHFDSLGGDIGMCTEPLQPLKRSLVKSTVANTKLDEKWARVINEKYGSTPPRDDKGRLKVYNSGVVLYTPKGLSHVKNDFGDFKEYMKLMGSNNIGGVYKTDQNYLHAMIFAHNVNFVEMDNGWNEYITWAGTNRKSRKTIYDPRTKNTKMVHIQFRGADHLNPEQHWKITNLPVDQWGCDHQGNPFVKGDPISGEPI